MLSNNARITRENNTIKAMANIYCHGQHENEGALCRECSELLDYAQGRLEKCPFRNSKPTCAKCPVHCYGSGMREKIRAVMRYAGPACFTGILFW